MITYPPGPVVPHGVYSLLKGEQPSVWLTAFDGSIEINLMGGMSIPDRTMPESVQVKRDGIKGLIAPWKTIDQKGATQDGTTFIDALDDPTEIDLTVMCKGRDGRHTRKVVRDLIGSIDKKQTSQLAWFTHELGKWWADVRWFKAPPDTIAGAQAHRQQLSLVLRADLGAWRTFDHVSSFRFAYTAGDEDFTTDTDEDLGDDWTVHYSGTGGGFVHVADGEAKWVDDPDHPILTGGRTVVARRDGFTTSTDNQVIEIELGSMPEWSFPDNGYNEIWGRTPTTGTPGDDGIRLRVGIGWIQLSYFVSGTETLLRERLLLLPPSRGDRFQLVCGYEGDPRMFKVMRNGSVIMQVKETGTGSQLGAGFRGAGFGMHAGAAILSQATPASVKMWTAGTNVTHTQTGHLLRMNIGDQPMFDRINCFGPGLFKIGNGPGATEFVEFGPLLAGQAAQIRTDPRKRGVVDLISTPATPQQQTNLNDALTGFLSFINSLTGLLGSGPVAPQGNLYSLLNGRFSDAAAIPAKSPGNPAQPYYVPVSIQDGNADSMIIASGTPLRKYPL